MQQIGSLKLDPRLNKLLLTYEEVFGALPPPLSCKKLSGDLCHWDTGTGNGTKRVPITAPMTRNSWPVCWCSHHSPDSWDLTLLSGSVARNR